MSFRSGHLTTATEAGCTLLGHELAHVAQQRSAGTTLTQKFDPFEAIDSLAEGAMNVAGDAVETGVNVAGDTLDTVTNVAADVADGDFAGAGHDLESGANTAWGHIESGAEAALADTAAGISGAADALGVGEAQDWLHEHLQLHLSFPQITLFQRMRGSMSWRQATENITIFADMVEVPYVGLVFLEAYARGEVSGTLGAGLGPGVLRGVELDLDPLGGYYRGTATLAIPADLRAMLALSGIVGGAANWMCLVDLIRIEGGLTGSATGNLATEFTDTVEVVYKDGEFTANNTPQLDACVKLALGLGALLDIKLLDQPVVSANWTLAEKPWDRCWRWPSYHGGGGNSGGGGSSDGYVLVANLSSLINGATEPGFSADEVVASSFGASAPVVAMKPLSAQAKEARAKADAACDSGKKKGRGQPCDEPLPILWPSELPLPDGELVRRGEGDSDGNDRGAAQRRMQKRIKKALERHEPPPSPCLADDVEPEGQYDAHHVHPLYLGGVDEDDNLCARDHRSHLRGHRRLDNQSDMAESDPEWFACKVTQGTLSRHPGEQSYYIKGRK